MNFLKRIMQFVYHQLAIPTAQRRGLILLLLSLILAWFAYLTLDLSIFDLASYWDVTLWLSTLGENGSPLAGLLIYLLAGAVFVAGLRRLGTPAGNEFPIATQAAQPKTPRLGFWATSLGLAALSFLHHLTIDLPGYNNHFEILLWLTSIGLLIATVWRENDFHLPGVATVKNWWRANQRELTGLGILLTGVLLLRLIDLEYLPFAFANDEGEMGKMALCLLNSDCAPFFTARWAFQPTLAFVPTAISVGIFGNTAVAVRLVSVLIGTLAVLFAYLFTRETFGQPTAWVAAVLAATFPPHVHFSRQGFDNIVDSLSSALLVWLVLRGARKNAPGYYLAAGLVAGLCFYTYPGSRLAPVIALGVLAWISLRTPRFLRAQWRNLLIFLITASVVAAPIAGHFTAYPANFMARLERESIFVNGPWQVQNKLEAARLAPVIAQQFFKSTLVFIATGGPLQFFNTPRPYFSPLGAILFVLGLAWLTTRLKTIHGLTLFAWFWAPVIIGSTLTVGAPSNQRMLASNLPAVIIAALSLTAIIQSLPRLNPLARRLAPALLLLTLLLNGVADIQYYFGDYRRGHYGEDLSNEITYTSHHYIAPLGEQGRLFLIGSPMMLTRFGNFDYFAPDVEKYDFNEITPQTLAELPDDKNALFLAIPSRETDLQTIASWLPGGKWSVEPRRYFPDDPLFFAYLVSQEQLQGFQP